MAKLNTLKDDPIKHVVVYGPPKVGKTLLVGKLARVKKLIWFDLERGFSTLFQLPAEWQENVEVIHIPDHRDYPMAIETMLKVFKGTKVSICEEHGKVGCPLCAKDPTKVQVTVELNALDKDYVVVVDSGTQLKNSALSNITKGKPIDYKLERDDWGNLSKLMDTFYSYVQAAPFNVVVISHEDEVKMTEGNDKIVPVGGSSNFSRNMAKYFDEVVYGRVANGKHTFLSSTTAANKILTGSRAQVDLQKAGEPDLAAIWGL
jgi:hypothetical protein